MHIEIVLEHLPRGEVSSLACGHTVPDRREEGDGTILDATTGARSGTRGQIFHVRVLGSDALTMCRGCAGRVARAIERGLFAAPGVPGSLVRP